MNDSNQSEHWGLCACIIIGMIMITFADYQFTAALILVTLLVFGISLGLKSLFKL